MDYSKTGNLIANLRKEKRLTQKELADKLGITDRAVSKWERGLGCPDISLLDDLSRILDISILEILKGRRLDKDEIVNNESIIESMNYSRENLKYRIKKYFNFAAIAIIVFIGLMLIISNLKSIYYLNKTYQYNYDDYNDIGKLEEIQKNIKIIKNSRGKYNEEDYKIILNYINELDKNLEKQNSYHYDKKSYTYSEIVKFYADYREYIFISAYSESSITPKAYNIVHSYDSRVINNVVYYRQYTNNLWEINTRLFEKLKYPYYNNKSIDNTIVKDIKDFIHFANERDSILLEDIIKVGDIDE